MVNQSQYTAIKPVVLSKVEPASLLLFWREKAYRESPKKISAHKLTIPIIENSRWLEVSEIYTTTVSHKKTGSFL